MADAATLVDVGSVGWIGVGAGLAMLGGAIGTGLAQSSVGASAVGVIAEKPEEMSKLILFYLIPETLVVFGFVVAFLLIGKIV
ncbi:ATP synthase subunit c [uncultured archaeon]|nr:ATP synthase subunit c [uncultured archaeon]